ncbi:MAG: hypothetical protein QOF58_8540 [Pseudonocardiales bacterium]|jgi:hypothetical protein|nr:hypothetical protein [Pseudonocardiales bacterium]
MSLRGFSTFEVEGVLEGATDESSGKDTEGTTVVPTTLARGSAPSGVTTGFECGGGVTTTRGAELDGATFTADGTGVNSMGGSSPPSCATSGSSAPAPDGPGTVTTPVDMATPARTPAVRSATPNETVGSGKPERTRQKLATKQDEPGGSPRIRLKLHSIEW